MSLFHNEFLVVLTRSSFRTHERFELAPHRARERRYEENVGRETSTATAARRNAVRMDGGIERNAVRGETKEAEIVKEREVCMLERA